jgi:hypothetical protein
MLTIKFKLRLENYQLTNECVYIIRNTSRYICFLDTLSMHIERYDFRSNGHIARQYLNLLSACIQQSQKLN